jgi:uncharacterized membrane protein
MIVFQVLLLIIAALLLFAGTRHYNILGITRHPWYLATIMLIWARGLDVSVLITNIILTIYLIVGTVLEERKLLVEYGEDYRGYQKKVSMLIPFKYVKTRIRRLLGQRPVE